MKKVDSSSGMNRRNVIRAGLSALAAGLLLKFVGADSVTVDRVQGANGQSIIIGANNTGSSTTTLSSPVNGAPNAFFDNAGGTGDAQAIQGRITGTTGRAFVGYAQATSGNTIALDGVNNSPSGIALRGANTATSGNAVGVQGSSAAPGGVAVAGLTAGASLSDQTSFGRPAILGIGDGTQSTNGVIGWNKTDFIGVIGRNYGTDYAAGFFQNAGAGDHIAAAKTGAVGGFRVQNNTSVSQDLGASGLVKAGVIVSASGTSPYIWRSFSLIPGASGITVTPHADGYTGFYIVSFPGADISERLFFATLVGINTEGLPYSANGRVSVWRRSGDTSAVRVATYDYNGVATDGASFYLMVV